MLVGAILTLAADTAPRALLGRDAPAGVTLTLIGAPVLEPGGVLAQGAPSRVLTPDALRAAFGVEVSILQDPDTGGPLRLPHSPEADRP